MNLYQSTKTIIQCVVVLLFALFIASAQAAKPTKNGELQLRTLSFENTRYLPGASVDVYYEVQNPRHGFSGQGWLQIYVSAQGSAAFPVAESVQQSVSIAPRSLLSGTLNVTLPTDLPDGSYSVGVAVYSADMSETIADLVSSQQLTVGQDTPPPVLDDWRLTVQNGKIYRNGAEWRSRGVNDYAVPRPYDLHDQSGSTAYLDKIASITGQKSSIEQIKADLPGLNTRRIPLSPRIIESGYENQRALLAQYIMDAKAVDDLVILSVYGSGQYGGVDFPERLVDDSDTQAILSRLEPVHAYFASLAADHGNVAIDLMNEYRGSDPQAWADLYGGAVAALRANEYDGLIFVGGFNWATRAEITAAMQILQRDETGNTCFGFHYYSDSNSPGSLNPQSMVYWPGMQDLLQAGACVGVDEVGVSIGNNINKDGAAGSAIDHMNAWRILFRDLPFVYSWQVLNDHNSLYGKLKVSKRRGGTVTGSWSEIYEGREPFVLNDLGQLHLDYFIRPTTP